MVLLKICVVLHFTLGAQHDICCNCYNIKFVKQCVSSLKEQLGKNLLLINRELTFFLWNEVFKVLTLLSVTKRTLQIIII